MTSTLNLQPSSKVGWLKKQGGLVKSWTTRWFALKGDQLYYFRKDDDTSLLGVIPLAGNKLVENPNGIDEPQNGKFFFEVLPGLSKFSNYHDSYILQASSQEERSGWLSALISIMFARLGGAVFGQELEKTLLYQRKFSTLKVPTVVHKCVTHLQKNALDHEGLFRLSGSVKLLKLTKHAFNTCENVDFERDGIDNNTIASLLKMYFKELPEPIIPFLLYEHFMTIGLKIQHGDPDKGMETLQNLLGQLPVNNYNLLKYISYFLSEVAKNSDKNKMTSNNLALVFGPNILRGDDDHPLLLMSTADLTIQTVLVLISQYDDAFICDYKGNRDHTPPISPVNLDIDFDKLYQNETNISSTSEGSQECSLLDLDDEFNQSNKLISPISPTHNETVDVTNNNGTTLSTHIQHDEDELKVEAQPVPQIRRKHNTSNGTINSNLSVQLRRTSTRRQRVFDQSFEAGEIPTDLGTEPTESVVSKSENNCDDFEQQLSNCSNLEETKVFCLTEQKRLINENSRLLKANKDNERKLEDAFRKICSITAKLDDERHATAQSVDRLVALQAQLLTYQMRFGNLEDMD